MNVKTDTFFEAFLDWLSGESHITEIQKKNLRAQAHSSSTMLIAFMLEHNWLDNKETEHMVKEVAGMELIWQDIPAIDREFVRKYPFRRFLHYRAVPLALKGEKLLVLMDAFPDNRITTHLQDLSGHSITPVITESARLDPVLFELAMLRNIDDIRRLYVHKPWIARLSFSPSLIPAAGEEIHFNFDVYDSEDDASDDALNLQGMTMIFPFIRKAVEYRKPVLIGRNYIELKHDAAHLPISRSTLWSLKHAISALMRSESFKNHHHLWMGRVFARSSRVLIIKLNGRFHKMTVTVKERISYCNYLRWLARLSFVETVPPHTARQAYRIPSDVQTDTSFLKPLNNLLRSAIVKRGVVYITGYSENEYVRLPFGIGHTYQYSHSGLAGKDESKSIRPSEILLLKEEHTEIINESFSKDLSGRLIFLLQAFASLAKRVGSPIKGKGECSRIPLKWQDRNFLARLQLSNSEVFGELPEMHPEPGLLPSLVDRAFQEKASAIHFHPSEKTVSVKFRIEGTLREVAQIERTTLRFLQEQLRGLCEKLHTSSTDECSSDFALTREGKEHTIAFSIIETCHGPCIVLKMPLYGSSESE